MYKVISILKSGLVNSLEAQLNMYADEGYRTVYFLDTGQSLLVVLKKNEKGRPRKDSESAELGE